MAALFGVDVRGRFRAGFRIGKRRSAVLKNPGMLDIGKDHVLALCVPHREIALDKAKEVVIDPARNRLAFLMSLDNREQWIAFERCADYERLSACITGVMGEKCRDGEIRAAVLPPWRKVLAFGIAALVLVAMIYIVITFKQAREMEKSGAARNEMHSTQFLGI